MLRCMCVCRLLSALVRCTRKCMEPTIQAEASVACCEAMHSLCSHNDEAWRKALGEADAATGRRVGGKNACAAVIWIVVESFHSICLLYRIESESRTVNQKYPPLPIC